MDQKSRAVRLFWMNRQRTFTPAPAFVEPFAGAELRPLEVCPALWACDDALPFTPAPRSLCGFILAEPEVVTLVLVSGTVVCALACAAPKAKAAAIAPAIM